MSNEVAQMDTPKAHKTHKHKSKDSTARRSSKKRRHDDDAAVAEAPAEAIPDSSPSKKQRTAEPEETTAATQDSPVPETQSSTDTKPPRPSAISDAHLADHSPFQQQTTSFFLPLAPVCHALPLAGLCAEHISPLLLTYYPPLRGVLLSYSNPRVSESPHHVPASHTSTDPVVLARTVDEYAVSYIWLTVDCVVLRPTRGACIEGYVTLQNESYLGIVCWNFFNAGIERRRLPSGWSWVGTGSGGGGGGGAGNSNGRGERPAAASAENGEGYFLDESGAKVEGLIRFRVKDFDSAPSTEREHGFLNIEGTLLGDEEDRKLDQELRDKQKGKSKGKRLGGASSNGV